MWPAVVAAGNRADACAAGVAAGVGGDVEAVVAGVGDDDVDVVVVAAAAAVDDAELAFVAAAAAVAAVAAVAAYFEGLAMETKVRKQKAEGRARR